MEKYRGLMLPIVRGEEYGADERADDRQVRLTFGQIHSAQLPCIRLSDLYSRKKKWFLQVRKLCGVANPRVGIRVWK